MRLPTFETGEMPGKIQSPSPPMIPLAVRLTIRISVALVVAVTVVLVPAGTARYWQALLFLALVSVPTIALMFLLLARDPAIIERRLQANEVSSSQKSLIRWYRPVFLIAAVIPGLDYRFGWSPALVGSVPLWLTLVCDGVAVTAILFAGWVIDINRFAGRTIRVEPGQPLVSTGPYCLVRHPLYSASLVLCLATPLALGSWIALPLFAVLVPFYALRLLNEEKLLRRQLEGYAAYCHRTPFRLIPFIW